MSGPYKTRTDRMNAIQNLDDACLQECFLACAYIHGERDRGTASHREWLFGTLDEDHFKERVYDACAEYALKQMQTICLPDATPDRIERAMEIDRCLFAVMGALDEHLHPEPYMHPLRLGLLLLADASGDVDTECERIEEAPASDDYSDEDRAHARKRCERINEFLKRCGALVEEPDASPLLARPVCLTMGEARMLASVLSDSEYDQGTLGRNALAKLREVLDT